LPLHLRIDSPVIPPCSPSDQGIRASGFTPRKGTRPQILKVVVTVAESFPENDLELFNLVELVEPTVCADVLADLESLALSRAIFNLKPLCQGSDRGDWLRHHVLLDEDPQAMGSDKSAVIVAGDPVV
jgi:hypothetical protein